MAVANTKSNGIANVDAQTMSSNVLFGGHVLSAVATVEVAAADDDGSVYRFFRLPSNAVILSLKLSNDAITGMTDTEVGLYDTAANGGAVVEKDIIADDIDCTSAANSVEILFHTNNIANIEKKLYELIPLSTDSGKDYDLCLTANTVGSAAGTLSMSILYSVG